MVTCNELLRSHRAGRIMTKMVTPKRQFASWADRLLPPSCIPAPRYTYTPIPVELSAEEGKKEHIF